MTTYNLNYPITIDGGAKISEVTIRRPKAKDMIALGRHFEALARLDEDATPGTETFEAMTETAALLAGLGDNAQELDLEDLTNIATMAFEAVGKSQADGTETAGETPLPSLPAA